MFLENFRNKKLSNYIFRGLVFKLAEKINKNAFLFLFRNRKKEYLDRIFLTANEAMAKDFDLTLEAYFNYADKGSMAHSIECRMPFMDYRLVEFLAGVPSVYKFHKAKLTLYSSI